MAPSRLGRKLAETTRDLVQRGIEEVQQENPDDWTTDEIDERLRDGEDGPAIFSGYVIRWDEPTTIYDWIDSFTEVFICRAFKKTIAERRLRSKVCGVCADNEGKESLRRRERPCPSSPRV